MTAANLSYRIEYDTCPDSPRNWDNLFTLYFTDNRHISGDERIREGYDAEDFVQSGEYIVLPVYAYMHSGVLLSPFPFSCPWDSGCIGFAVISRADLMKEFGWKRITAKRWRRLEELLQGELQTYADYLNGEVYGYVIEDEAGDELFSCWGFYGHDYCEEEARRMIEYYQKNEQAEVAA